MCSSIIYNIEYEVIETFIQSRYFLFPTPMPFLPRVLSLAWFHVHGSVISGQSHAVPCLVFGMIDAH